MALDPNIAMGYRGVEIANPLVQYGQVAQIQAAQNQNQVSQMQLDQMRRDEETMRQIQAKAVAHGGPSDLNLIADAYINSGNHKFIEFGVGLRQKLDEKAQFAKIMGLGGPTGAPEPTAAPAAAPTVPAAPTVAYPQTAAPTNALGSGTFGMSPAAAPVNALAPAVAPTALAAPVNALTAPPVGPDITLLRRKRDMFLAMGTAQGNAAAKTMDAEIALASKEPVYHNVPGVGLVDPRTARVVMPEGVKDSEFEKLLARSNLSDAQKNALRIQRAQKEATHAPGTTVNLPPQEKAFESELGKGQAESIIKSKTAAQDAASIINTVNTGRDLMKSGMITGAGADFLVNFNQALKTAGIDAGFADAAANSQAFTAAMGANVGKLIKQFGAGTGLSNDDRKFATDMAGGRISLDAKAINRILDINERAARNVITQHNKDVKGIKTNIPLEVEMPSVTSSAPAATVPSSAVAYLRANPSMKGAFDAKYGAGAADRALKGQ